MTAHEIAAAFGTRGPVGRARTNLAILERLAALRARRIVSDEDDRSLLSQWCGWGPMAKVLDERDPEEPWAGIQQRLKPLLTDGEWAAAQEASPTSFYTSPVVARAAWQILSGLGFSGGRALEPGCGHGVFIAHAPDGTSIDWTGIDRDPVASRIAQLLHPDARIITDPLQRVPLRDDYFDVAVGNVPFAEVVVFDPTAPPGLTQHNYFIWRAVRAVRPGGLVALVTSRYTLDAQDDAQRRAVAELADLVGALRLPAGTFHDSGTEVVADILVFRRRAEGEPARDQSWLRSIRHPEFDGSLHWSEYFLQHPDQVLGRTEATGSMWRGGDLTVRSDVGDAEFAEALRAGVQRIVDAGLAHSQCLAPREISHRDASEPLIAAAGFKEGSFQVLDDGCMHQVQHGKFVLAPDSAELRSLIGLRDAALLLIGHESDPNAEEKDLEWLRAQLNRIYDGYVARYGALNRCTILEGPPDPDTGLPTYKRRRPAMGGFRADPDYVSVIALEDFDDESGKAEKSQLMRRRVNRPRVRATHADSPAEAIALCLDELGRFDLPRVAALMGLTEDATSAALGDLVFENPQTGAPEIASEYLSGDVRQKLATAKLAADTDPGRYERNVDALEKVLPPWLTSAEIKVRLGAPWIDASTVKQFIKEVVGDLDDVVNIPEVAMWEVSAPAYQRDRPAARSRWGTDRIDAYKLIELGLNNQAPIVYDEIEVGSERRSVRNPQETLLAQEKLRELNERFAEWLWDEPVRADRLCTVYNERFNAIVPRRYDGSHLTFPGLVDGFEPRQSQLDMVYRIISSPATLCGFSVGAGKTAIMFCAALTMRRLGLAAKPMIVVPNHLLEQIARDGKRLFPTARILMVGREDLTAERRRLFAARCAGSEWDAVVITHSAFTAIGVHPETEDAYLQTVVQRYKKALMGRDTSTPYSSAGRRSFKRLQKLLEAAEERQKALLAHRTDTGLVFEQLGVDYLLVDEAHYFKNLGFPARAEGFSVSASKRAQDLAMKFTYLRERNGGARWGSLFTGTPVSNSLVELYVLSLYLQPDLLAHLGVDVFDAWAANFVQLETKVEVSPDGGGFRVHTRPSRFNNVPELRRIFGEVADVRSRSTLGLPGPEAHRETEVVEPAPEFGDVIASLVQRADALRARGDPPPGAPKNDNMLLVCTDGRKAALDLSLVGIHTDAPSKADAVVRRVFAIWRAHEKPDWLDRAKERLHELYGDKPAAPTTRSTGPAAASPATVQPSVVDDFSSLDLFASPQPGGQGFGAGDGAPPPDGRASRRWQRLGTAGQMDFLGALYATPAASPAHPLIPLPRHTAPPVRRAATHQATSETLQIVFCDLGTPNESSDQVYGKIRDGLIKAGMAPSLVRFIHDAKTDVAKAHLFAECRNGHVAVLLGSTDKLGVGTNIQTRCVAIHHVDAPWRPADVEQREGRALRPGNRNATVSIIRYVTRGSFDAYMWQTLERKIKFVEQILQPRAVDNLREVEDIGDGVLTYSEVKALATGNPLVMELYEAQAELSRLRELAKGHERNRRSVAYDASQRREEAAHQLEEAEVWEQIAAAAQAGTTGELLDTRGEPVAPGGEGRFLAAEIAHSTRSSDTRTRAIGQWCGTDLGLRFVHLMKEDKAFLEVGPGWSRKRRPATIPVNPTWAKPAEVWRLSRALSEARGRAVAERARLLETAAALNRDADSAERLAGEPFPQGAELARLLARCEAIEAEMNSRTEREAVAAGNALAPVPAVGDDPGAVGTAGVTSLRTRTLDDDFSIR